MATLYPEGYRVRRAARQYLSHWNRDKSQVSKVDYESITSATDQERRERAKNYNKIGSDYYDLVTPMYEQGWGQKFHYSPLTPGLTLGESHVVFEKEYGQAARLKKGMRVLDLGCGVGGPARTIAKNVGCHIVGITNSAWHVQRATALTKEAGLDHMITFVEGDFMKLPFPDESFDAAYSIEALCYAPDPTEVYKEIKRVLKPGAPFTFHDFAMTEKFNEKIPEHRKIRNWIEFGNGLARMPWVPEMREGVKKAGFELLAEDDPAFRSSPVPWYYSAAGDVISAWRVPGWHDFLIVLQLNGVFLFFARIIYRIMILFGITSPEVLGSMDTMWYCCRSVAMGGKLGIFSPMYRFLCVKPAAPGPAGGAVHGQVKG